MRKAILTVLMALVLVIPAYAAEGDPAVDQPIQQEQEKEPVVVATLEELQAAIDIAEDGDIIALNATIKMLDGDTLVTDKHITLVRHEELKKSGGRMIEIPLKKGMSHHFCSKTLTKQLRRNNLFFES